MKRTLIFILSFWIFATLQGQEPNPFFVTWDTPFQLPPFDKIRMEHYLPAFSEGMKSQTREIDAIVNDSSDPSFENTILAYDNSGQLLEKVSLVFFSLNSAFTNPEMQSISRKLSPLTTKHYDDVHLNPKLFSRIKFVYERLDALSLDSEQVRLVREIYQDFIRGGADLDSLQQSKLRDVNKRINLLQVTFGQNLLSETNAFRMTIDKKENLSGLPQQSVDAAAELAKRDSGSAGNWIFTLQNSSLIPFLQNSNVRQLREIMFKAYYNRGNNNNDKDNKALVAKLVLFRSEKAKILGYPTFADYVLDDRMARKPENVYQLLDQVWAPAIRAAKEEAVTLQNYLSEKDKSLQLEPWDWKYCSEKVRVQKYGINEDSLKPYLVLDNVRSGAFFVANKLYGITFHEVKNPPRYFPDVTLWECRDEDGTLLGLLYHDLYPRTSKRSGAWTSSFRHQAYQGGKRITPVMTIACNFPLPSKDMPALLSSEEAETFFHEFGHALAGLLKDVKYAGLSSVPRDFVELPSQIMEHWVFEPEVMKNFARHYKTGAIVPAEMVAKIIQTRKYGQGFRTTEYLAAAYLDMDFHHLSEATNINVISFEQQTMDRIGLIPEIFPRYRATNFQHSMTGSYTAGYYGYIWAEVLDADAFSAFQETGDIFNRTVAEKFRRNILEKAGSKDPVELYVDFRGSMPKVDALLENRGLK